MDREPVDPNIETKINPLDFYDATKELIPYIKERAVVFSDDNIVPMHYLIENISEQKGNIQILGYNPDKKKTFNNQKEFQILPGHNFTYSTDEIKKFDPDTAISFFKPSVELVDSSLRFIFVGKENEIINGNDILKDKLKSFKLIKKDSFIKNPNDKSDFKMFIFNKLVLLPSSQDSHK